MRRCDICGQPMPGATALQKRHGGACAEEKHRQRARDYARRQRSDPARRAEYLKRHSEWTKRKRENDPAFREREREWQRESRLRRILRDSAEGRL